ncbi:MAG: 1-aminocyclopropane-1-carboxylate deaminase/D-cysteine desulfhydrase [Campylobacterales bacterium]|nr:1-aminocyclopropane-1-carboxylate deaminase/D-cysteine desulfhydrase [Campylobacterales bacterium]
MNSSHLFCCTHSPIHSIEFNHQTVYIKRDDLLHCDFSGNKARKLYYYLTHDFPNITQIVSYGSIQSNAMYSLSVLAKLKGWEFVYIVERIPSYLQANPQGNYKEALANGMQVVFSKEEADIDTNTLWIEEGAREEKAQFGIDVLAKEIVDWQKAHEIKNLAIVLPSGTGTTALFLQKYLFDYGIQVYTTPCVGDKAYLIEQFDMLENDKRYFPTVLALDRKYHFGKLYRNNWEIWKHLKATSGIEFDLLYDPKGWLMIAQHQELFKNTTLLYIHQGGLMGNRSMIERYKRKFP